MFKSAPFLSQIQVCYFVPQIVKLAALIKFIRRGNLSDVCDIRYVISRKKVQLTKMRSTTDPRNRDAPSRQTKMRTKINGLRRPLILQASRMFFRNTRKLPTRHLTLTRHDAPYMVVIFDPFFSRGGYP